MTQPPPVAIGSRLELFVDDALVETLTGRAELRLNRPVMGEVVLETDRPWEGNKCLGYKTYFRDGDRFRMYYQVWNVTLTQEADGEVSYDESPVTIGYAESRDGVRWERPELGQFEVAGSTANNVVFRGFGQHQTGVHGFAPFRDTNPDCEPDARYKAMGTSMTWPGLRLYALKSPDGLHWSTLRDEPVITDGAFDSQNLAFWDMASGQYRAYLRDFDGETRGIKTCTSPDFIHWTEPKWLSYPGAPVEQLYTNQVLPYYRAPHILMGFPMRYVDRPWTPTIDALPEPEHRTLRARVSPRFGSAVTDTVYMASRDGYVFKRWDEAFIRPGPRARGSWTYGDTAQGWGLLQTAATVADAPDELSLYVSEGYWRGTSTTLRRYTIRVDGFVSLRAPGGGGELVTKPLVFSGDQLVLNTATAAAGSVLVEVQDPAGHPLPGCELANCFEVVGDGLAVPVRWREDRLGDWAGQPVRLRLVVRDADLYSYRFTSRSPGEPTPHQTSGGTR